MGSLVDLNRRMARRAYELKLSIEEAFPDSVTAQTGQEILSVIQEALTNARRHASASHVSVRLGTEGEYAWAEVADDGRGFEPGAEHAGIGSHSLRQRAHELDGELIVDSAPGAGTRIWLRIPKEKLYL